MTKLEYDNFYKFIASLGIGLIAIAAFSFWLFFKEPFDLLIESSKLETLTPVAKEIILFRQNLILKALPVIQWGTMLLLIIGFFITALGMYLWYNKQQKILDEHQKLSNEKLKKEIETLKPAEVISNLANDVAEDIAEDMGQEMPQQEIIERVTLEMSSYLMVENAITSKLIEAFSDTHIAWRNRRVEGREYDLILRSKQDNDVDYIIEIKNKKRNISTEWLRKKAWNVLTSIGIYMSATDRLSCTPVFIVAIPSEKVKLFQFMSRKILEDKQISMVMIRITAEEDVNNLTVTQVREWFEL